MSNIPKIFYKCEDCGCIHKKEIKKCEGCNQTDIKTIAELDIKDIVSIIRDYEWRKDQNNDNDYWSLVEYSEEEFGIDYIYLSEGFKIAEVEGIVVKKELIFYPE